MNMKKKTKKQSGQAPAAGTIRHQRMVCLVSEEELAIINGYLQKYKITNKGRWMRETLLAFIHHNMVNEDYPTLFNEYEMRR